MTSAIVLGALLMLTACSSPQPAAKTAPRPAVTAPKPAPAQRKIPAKANAPVRPVAEYMAAQESDLVEALAGSDIRLFRRRNSLTLVIPGNLAFNSNSYNLKEKAGAELKKIAPVLRYYDKTRINVVGHTDNTGRPATNMMLSEKRAESVAAALAGSDIQKIRFWVDGKGASDPAASNKTAEGREKNNRIEIVLTPTIR